MYVHFCISLYIGIKVCKLGSTVFNNESVQSESRIIFYENTIKYHAATTNKGPEVAPRMSASTGTNVSITIPKTLEAEAKPTLASKVPNFEKSSIVPDTVANLTDTDEVNHNHADNTSKTIESTDEKLHNEVSDMFTNTVISADEPVLINKEPAVTDMNQHEELAVSPSSTGASEKVADKEYETHVTGVIEIDTSGTLEEENARPVKSVIDKERVVPDTATNNEISEQFNIAYNDERDTGHGDIGLQTISVNSTNVNKQENLTEKAISVLVDPHVSSILADDSKSLSILAVDGPVSTEAGVPLSTPGPSGPRIEPVLVQNNSSEHYSTDHPEDVDPLDIFVDDIVYQRFPQAMSYSDFDTKVLNRPLKKLYILEENDRRLFSHVRQLEVTYSLDGEDLYASFQFRFIFSRQCQTIDRFRLGRKVGNKNLAMFEKATGQEGLTERVIFFSDRPSEYVYFMSCTDRKESPYACRDKYYVSLETSRDPPNQFPWLDAAQELKIKLGLGFDDPRFIFNFVMLPCKRAE